MLTSGKKAVGVAATPGAGLHSLIAATGAERRSPTANPAASACLIMAEICTLYRVKGQVSLATARTSQTCAEGVLWAQACRCHKQTPHHEISVVGCPRVSVVPNRTQRKRSGNERGGGLCRCVSVTSDQKERQGERTGDAPRGCSTS